ncbi:MAG: hypothetical protein U0840_23520 [Gemmataceae bacterium]
MAARARGSGGSTQSAPARSDAYTGLLLISLLFQILGVVFFYLDWSAYPQGKPAVPQMPNLSAPAAGGAAPVPAPAMGGGAPPMGGAAPPMAGGAPPMAGGAPPMAGGAPPMGGAAPPMAGGNP